MRGVVWVERASEVNELRGIDLESPGEFLQSIYLGRRRIPETLKTLDMAVGKIGSLSQRFLSPTLRLPKLAKMLGELNPNIGRHMGILGAHDLLSHDPQGV